jgi:hypothetical protein
MNNLLRVLMRYQEKGNTILTQLQGSSVSLQDVLFYTLALSIPLIFITYPSDVRILLLAGVLTCWGAERAVLQHYLMLLGPARRLSEPLLEAATDGTLSGGSAGSFLRVHDVKVAIRLVVLGGTLGVVVWLLLKRRAAHNRQEAIFQAIQQSVGSTLRKRAYVSSTCLLHVFKSRGRQFLPTRFTVICCKLRLQTRYCLNAVTAGCVCLQLQQAHYHGAAAAYRPAPAAAAQQPAPAHIHNMQIVSAGPSFGQQVAKNTTAAFTAYRHQPALPILAQHPHPGVVLPDAAMTDSLQLHKPAMPGGGSARGWLPGSLFGSSQRSNLSDGLHPAQVMQLTQQMGSHAGVHAQALTPAHLSQTPLGLHVQPHMLLPAQQQQQQQALHVQASQQLQAVQHHVDPSADPLAPQQQQQQQHQASRTQSKRAMETEGTAASQDVEAFVGMGAVGRTAAGRQRKCGRIGSTAKASAAAGKASTTAAAKKRTAAAAHAGEASREQSAVVEGAAGQTPKQGQPKRKK